MNFFPRKAQTSSQTSFVISFESNVFSLLASLTVIETQFFFMKTH